MANQCMGPPLEKYCVNVMYIKTCKNKTKAQFLRSHFISWMKHHDDYTEGVFYPWHYGDFTEDFAPWHHDDYTEGAFDP